MAEIKVMPVSNDHPQVVVQPPTAAELNATAEVPETEGSSRSIGKVISSEDALTKNTVHIDKYNKLRVSHQGFKEVAVDIKSAPSYEETTVTLDNGETVKAFAYVGPEERNIKDQPYAITTDDHKLVNPGTFTRTEVTDEFGVHENIRYNNDSEVEQSEQELIQPIPALAADHVQRAGIDRHWRQGHDLVTGINNENYLSRPGSKIKTSETFIAITEEAKKNLIAEESVLLSDLETITEGGTVTLTGNTTLSSPLAISKPVNLDLDGYTLSLATETATDNAITFSNLGDATVTIDNGTIESTGRGIAIDSGTLVIGKTAAVKSATRAINCTGNGSVVINGGLENAGTNSDPTAFLMGEKGTSTSLKNGQTSTNSPSIVVYGSVVNRNDNGVPGGAIQTNGLELGTPTITIKEGAIVATCDSTAIYHAGKGIVNIEGGEISGSVAIETRGGTVTVSGGKLTSTITPTESIANSNGSTTDGAAFVVSPHTTGLEQNITITGGEFNCKEGGATYYEVNTVGDKAGTLNVSITGGTFNGPVLATRGTKFISKSDSGSPLFSVEPAAELIADGVTLVDSNTEGYKTIA